MRCAQGCSATNPAVLQLEADFQQFLGDILANTYRRDGAGLY